MAGARPAVTEGAEGVTVEAMTPSEMALLQRLADEVHSIAQDWPEVRNAISRIDARLNEHERRIHRVETFAMSAEAFAGTLIDLYLPKKKG